METVTKAHPDKPIFVITIFENGNYHEIEASDWKRDLLAKNEIVRKAAAKFPSSVELFEGMDIVSDLRGFQVDLLHPEPFAFARMAPNLAEKIENSPLWSRVKD